MLGRLVRRVALRWLLRWARSKGQTWFLSGVYLGARRWLKGSLRTLSNIQLDFRVLSIGASVHAHHAGSAARYFNALNALPTSVFVVPHADAAVSFFYNPEQIRVEEVVRFVQTLDVELEIVLPPRQRQPS